MKPRIIFTKEGLTFNKELYTQLTEEPENLPILFTTHHIPTVKPYFLQKVKIEDIPDNR